AIARHPVTRLAARDTSRTANTPPPGAATPEVVELAWHCDSTTPRAASAGSNGLPRLTEPLEKMQPLRVSASPIVASDTAPLVTRLQRYCRRFTRRGAR